MELWSIQFESILTGEKQYYMDIGFKCPEQHELDRLNRQREKHPLSETEVRNALKNGHNILSCYLGINWEIVKRKLRKSN